MTTVAAEHTVHWLQASAGVVAAAPGWTDALLGLGVASEDLGPAQIALRALIVYGAVVVMVRLGSRRFLSKATPFDAVVAIMLGSIMSSAITGSIPLLTTIAAGGAIMAAHWMIAFLAARVSWFGPFFKGERRLLIKDGEVQKDELRQAKLSMADLKQALREEAGDPDPAKIRRAYLERNGGISVMAFDSKPQIIETRVESGVQIIRIEIGPA